MSSGRASGSGTHAGIGVKAPSKKGGKGKVAAAEPTVDAAYVRKIVIETIDAKNKEQESSMLNQMAALLDAKLGNRGTAGGRIEKTDTDKSDRGGAKDMGDEDEEPDWKSAYDGEGDGGPEGDEGQGGGLSETEMEELVRLRAGAAAKNARAGGHGRPDDPPRGLSPGAGEGPRELHTRGRLPSGDDGKLPPWLQRFPMAPAEVAERASRVVVVFDRGSTAQT